jgi:Flp pilus assembly protein protease CpaA
MGGASAIWVTDLIALVTIGVLAVAAFSDLATRTLPDQACVALALLGLGARMLVSTAALAMSAGTAIGLFAVLVLLHARGALGGGDVKLAAAMAVGLAPMQTYRFLVATVLAGGVLSLLQICCAACHPRNDCPGDGLCGGYRWYAASSPPNAGAAGAKGRCHTASPLPAAVRG